MKKKMSIVPMKTTEFKGIKKSDLYLSRINFQDNEDNYRKKYLSPIAFSIYRNIRDKWNIILKQNCRYALVNGFGSETKIMNFINDNISKERLEKIVAYINEDSNDNIDNCIMYNDFPFHNNFTIPQSKIDHWKDIQDEFISFIKDNDKVIPEKEVITHSDSVKCVGNEIKQRKSVLTKIIDKIKLCI